MSSTAMKKKVLLMGKSGSGKTSMRSIIFANYIARDTRRLGATIDVEHSHVRFLGNLVLNLWDCGGSMVIRDLTLRSAASFGSFHLIRLLYDEYMFYLVEHRVARATGETPIAVMGEFSDLSAMMPSLLEKDHSFSDDMSDLGSDGDVSRGTCEPAVKRERIEISHSLQEI